MAEEHKRLSEILTQASTYKFLTVVKSWAEKAKELSQKENSYLLNNLNDFKEEWLEAEIKEEFPASKIELISSGGGVFEIKIGNDVIFSKKSAGRFPEPGEISSLIREY